MQAGGVQRGVAVGGKGAGVGEGCGDVQHQVAIRVDAAAVGETIAGLDCQGLGGVDPAAVVQAGGLQVQLFGSRELSIGVVQRASLELKVCCGAVHVAARVVQAGAGHAGAGVADDAAVRVVEFAAHAQLGALRGAALDDACARVVQVGGVQRDVLGFGAGVLQVNGAAFDLQGPGAVDAAPRTVQARRAELQPRGVAGDAARPVVELARQGQAQLAAAGLLEPPALVVQRVRAQAQRPGIEPGAFGAQALRGAHLQGAWHHYLGLAQVQRAAAGVVAGVGGTGVHAREVQRPRADAAVSARAQVSVQGGVARAANLQLALPGGGLALGVHACEQRRAGTGADVALRADAGVAAGLQGAAGAEPAVAGEHQIARRGGDEAGVVHAQSGFGAHQEDLAGVHAPQGRHVQRKLRALVGALHGAQHARRARAGARHIVGTR